jgi:hypothetical protein
VAGTTSSGGGPQQGSVGPALKQVLADEVLRTGIEREKAKQADAKAEASSHRRGPWVRGALQLLGFVTATLGVGDSLRPDTPELIKNASAVELAIFHNEADSLKLMALGSSLLGGSLVAGRKQKKAAKANG